MAKLGSNEATVTSASVRTAQSDGRIRSGGGQPGRSRVRCCSCAPAPGARPRPLPPAAPARQRRLRLRLARAGRAERARRRAQDRPARGQGRRTAPSARPRRPSRLRHERCLRAYGFGSDSGHVYIAYEYVGGRTLREAMRGGELRDGQAVEAAAQILDGLAHAHSRGIVHRDVKPSNVLLAEDDGISVRLLDFGLAQFDEAETLTAVGDVPGTLAYISPERLRGEEACAASDVWAVGILLWEALAGKHPFWGVPLPQMAGTIEAGAPPLQPERPDLPKRLLGRDLARARAATRPGGPRPRRSRRSCARRSPAASVRRTSKVSFQTQALAQRVAPAAARRGSPRCARRDGAALLSRRLGAGARGRRRGSPRSARPAPVSRSRSRRRCCRSATTRSGWRSSTASLALGWLALSLARSALRASPSSPGPLLAAVGLLALVPARHRRRGGQCRAGRPRRSPRSRSQPSSPACAASRFPSARAIAPPLDLEGIDSAVTAARRPGRRRARRARARGARARRGRRRAALRANAVAARGSRRGDARGHAPDRAGRSRAPASCSPSGSRWADWR